MTNPDKGSLPDARESEDFTICPECGEDLLHHDCRPTIREQNDAFRTDTALIGERIARDQLVITRGVAALGNAFIERAVQAVRAFSDFTKDNDPYGEHDFGAFELDGENLLWKIDAYDNELKYGSPDPREPEETRRVLTVLLEGEY